MMHLLEEYWQRLQSLVYNNCLKVPKNFSRNPFWAVHETMFTSYILSNNFRALPTCMVCTSSKKYKPTIVCVLCIRFVSCQTNVVLSCIHLVAHRLDFYQTVPSLLGIHFMLNDEIIYQTIGKLFQYCIVNHILDTPFNWVLSIW